MDVWCCLQQLKIFKNNTVKPYGSLKGMRRLRYCRLIFLKLLCKTLLVFAEGSLKTFQAAFWNIRLPFSGCRPKVSAQHNPQLGRQAAAAEYQSFAGG